MAYVRICPRYIDVSYTRQPKSPKLFIHTLTHTHNVCKCTCIHTHIQTIRRRRRRRGRIWEKHEKKGSCRLEQGKKQRMRKKRKQFFFICLVVVLELFETGIVLNKSPIHTQTHTHTRHTSQAELKLSRGKKLKKCSIQAGACFEYHTIA